MNGAACILFGYFTGTINPAYITGKRKGMDIRSNGSGNAGASNAMLLMGKLVGVMCALLDILKSYVVFKAAQVLFPGVKAAGILAGSACILGHIFPVWMGFRGGKGLASLGGLVLAYNWKLFVLLILLELVLVWIFDYICVVAITGSVAFPVLYCLAGGAWIGTLALSIVAMAMVYKHMENLRRIQAGTEMRISYLWNEEAELNRVLSNMEREQ